MNIYHTCCLETWKEIPIEQRRRALDTFDSVYIQIYLPGYSNHELFYLKDKKGQIVNLDKDLLPIESKEVKQNKRVKVETPQSLELDENSSFGSIEEFLDFLKGRGFLIVTQELSESQLAEWDEHIENLKNTAISPESPLSYIRQIIHQSRKRNPDKVTKFNNLESLIKEGALQFFNVEYQSLLYQENDGMIITKKNDNGKRSGLIISSISWIGNLILLFLSNRLTRGSALISLCLCAFCGYLLRDKN